MNIAPCPQWLIDIARKDAKPRKTITSPEHSKPYVLLGSGCSVPDVKAVKRFAGRPLDGAELLEYANSLDIGMAVAELLNLPTQGIDTDGRGPSFKCILPGHAEAKPSASLWRSPETGAVLYRDWHRQDGDEWYSLTQVYAFLKYGQVKKLSGPELATWQIRLLVELGKLEPYPVPAQTLPSDAAESVRQVYEGFRLLLGCKWRYTPDEPTPFARKFVAAWCAVSESTAARAIHELQNEYRVIRIVGQHGHLRVWLPSSMRG